MRTIKLAIPILFIILFFVLHLPGVSLPYHQDEWKNVSASATVIGAGAFFAHPPLMQMMFVAVYKIFGVDYFRLFPLLVSFASTILLYLVVRNRMNIKIALWSIVLYATNFYAVLGSLVPDVDGAILPFFFLLSVYTYDKWMDFQKFKWFLLLIGSLLVGFLIKLSFVLVVGTLTVDYIFNQWQNITTRKVVLGLTTLTGFGLIYVFLLYLIHFIYPAFDLDIMFGHANQFAGDVGRNWIQVIVQGVKAIFYLSPLLFVPLLYLSKETFKRLRIFFIYLILGSIFYFVLFDFSRGALDKYLMFAIIPLVVIIGTILRDLLNFQYQINKKSFLVYIAIGIAISVLLIVTNFMTHAVVPLYPKEEWFNRVLHFDWKILNPFNGGSGPLGFYVSFLFIAVSFVISLIIGVIGYFKKEWRGGVTVILMIIGLTYNLVFTEELMFGKINGSSSEVLKSSVSFITKTDSIKKVLSYNDIGNHELSMISKYAGRIYATPQSETGYKKKFTEFDGHYLVVEIPKMSGFYQNFFKGCQILFETSSGKITGRVYNCPQNQ